MSDMPPPATAAILTLGCKLNIADSEAIARRLRDAGWRVVDRAADADAVIVNTCSVTHVADQKSRHLVRVAQRIAPNATVAVTGCLLETAAPEKIDAMDADLVYRQVDQMALADKLIALGTTPPPGPLPVLPGKDGEGEFGPRSGTSRPSSASGRADAEAGLKMSGPENSPSPSFPGRTGRGPGGGVFKTRAFISAQEGCNDVCAFCIIPKTRGRERSKTVEWVVEEARKREAEGVQEIVITGTQLGHYGSDIGVGMYDLLKALLEETSIPRIRMSSVQPQDLSDDLIGLWEDPRLCRHYHLALQSGSEAVLRRMRRRYSKAEYRDAVHRLREAVPGMAITTDVIAGFPGETAGEFDECYAFCEEMNFAGIHVFPYSQRSGTVAFKMADQVSEPVKKQRVHALIELATRMSRGFREQLVGQTTHVLWETRHDDPVAEASLPRWEGLTDTYVRIRTRSDDDLTNTLTAARITALGEEGLQGEVIA